MMELENLGYTAFAFGYFQDDTQYASTTTAKCWASPQNIEYLHAMNFDVVFEFYLLRFILHKVNLLKMNGKIGKYAAVKCIAVDPH